MNYFFFKSKRPTSPVFSTFLAFPDLPALPALPATVIGSVGLPSLSKTSCTVTGFSNNSVKKPLKMSKFALSRRMSLIA